MKDGSHEHHCRRPIGLLKEPILTFSTGPIQSAHMDVHIRLTRRGDLSMQIYRQLLEAVLDGRLRPGERLPPTRELARRLDVSRNTVGVAYERLVADGAVVGRVGRGVVRQQRTAATRADAACADGRGASTRRVARDLAECSRHRRRRLQSRLPPATTSASARPIPRCFRLRPGGVSSRTNIAGRRRNI